MNDLVLESFRKLKDYCESESFKGWDPYDGLNSKIFNILPFRHWDLARLMWIQLFKRCPFNARKFFLVPKDYNAKGIGLFLSGYCNLYKLVDAGNTSLGSKEELLGQINKLAEILISLKVEGYSGACWGYNFDWQARRLFLFPKNTPTVVATTFCATALFEAYAITKNQEYLKVALSSADFVVKDLNRTNKRNGFLFSYSPLNGNNTVYNASLLGSKLLIYCYLYSKKTEYYELAKKSIIACVDAQEKDGSWVYGELPVQGWKDSFHTGYNLDVLSTFQCITNDQSFNNNIEKGTDFYIRNFFLSDGTPKYYDNKVYPIDIHCPAQLLVTLHRLDKYKTHKDLAEKVLFWAINNMQNKKGYFYYQIKEYINSKIPYMRWSQAFMFYGMSFYLLNSNIIQNE